MTLVNRVLDREAVPDLAAYAAAGGGKGLEAARGVSPAAVIDTLDAAGLRGRGGAGFPTGRKWRTVLENRSSSDATTVVVNAAEGEPGSFKDRAILRANPYRTLEGACIAATVVGADRIVVALKASADYEAARVEAAIAEIVAAGWADRISVEVVRGPSEYLFGEETALLEVLDGRLPFPRIAPPFREGVEDDDRSEPSPPDEALAGSGAGAQAPALVNNVETLANVPGIVVNGADWFRSIGTAQSPGSVVCTVSGVTRHDGVVEVEMGTPLRDVVDAAGEGVSDAGVSVVLAGVSNPLLPASALDAAVSYEGMEAVGAGLGTAGFIVFGRDADPVAIAHGVARFLAVESCGQCQPCKADGLTLASTLDRIRRSEIGDHLTAVQGALATVADGARCSLASQQQLVVGSLLGAFPEAFERHCRGEVPAADPHLVAPILDLPGDTFLLDEAHATKQPDWSFDDVDSGAYPAQRFDQSSGEAHAAGADVSSG
jgi:NADH:ubiquinone oxidoreductase subunit F (NADH-binding)